jgi:hypothetical protein
MRTSSFSFSDGFSLLEIAIVLIIISLAIGSLMIGSNLKRMSELRSIGVDYQRYIQAVSAFQEKYGWLPGDMPNATSMWGVADATPALCRNTPSTGTETCNGNGDGAVVWDTTGAHASPGTNEIFRFWQHLANAGLIEGHYNGVAGPLAPWGEVDSRPGINTPMPKVPGAAWNLSFLETVPNAYLHYEGFFPGKYGNTMAFGSSNSHGIAADTALLTPAEASSIDRKLDDGKPGTGKLRTFNTQWLQCATSDDPQSAQYIAMDDSPACSLIFPGSF